MMGTTYKSDINIHLPLWLREYSSQYQASTDIQQRMAFVISASQLNIDKKTGGPFAAAVFETNTGKLVALGVNLVTNQNLSILHAEIVALTLAQQALGHFDLAPDQLELITSTEPCAMCLGAIPWSGIRRVITGATAEHAEAIGFDEGDKPLDWCKSLQKRGIEVISGIRRAEAKAVLDAYGRQGGTLYNGACVPAADDTAHPGDHGSSDYGSTG